LLSSLVLEVKAPTGPDVTRVDVAHSALVFFQEGLGRGEAPGHPISVGRPPHAASRIHSSLISSCCTFVRCTQNLRDSARTSIHFELSHELGNSFLAQDLLVQRADLVDDAELLHLFVLLVHLFLRLGGQGGASSLLIFASLSRWLRSPILEVGAASTGLLLLTLLDLELDGRHLPLLHLYFVLEAYQLRLLGADLIGLHRRLAHEGSLSRHLKKHAYVCRALLWRHREQEDHLGVAFQQLSTQQVCDLILFYRCQLGRQGAIAVSRRACTDDRIQLEVWLVALSRRFAGLSDLHVRFDEVVDRE
jgi:hypothetical protein